MAAEKSNKQTKQKRKLNTNTVRSNHSVHVWLSQRLRHRWSYNCPHEFCQKCCLRLTIKLDIDLILNMTQLAPSTLLRHPLPDQKFCITPWQYMRPIRFDSRLDSNANGGFARPYFCRSTLHSLASDARLLG